MSTTDSEDPDTEILVETKTNRTTTATTNQKAHIEPAQIYSQGLLLHTTTTTSEENEKEQDLHIDSSDRDCIFPFIDLDTAGNGVEDWEIFNILCGVLDHPKGKVSF